MKIVVWSKIFEVGVKCLHWLTGLFVHPDRGGCCTDRCDFDFSKKNENESVEK